MEAQFYNTTKIILPLYRLRNNSQHLLARNTGSRWIVLTVICKRMQQLQARMELRVNHGMDTTHIRL